MQDPTPNVAPLDTPLLQRIAAQGGVKRYPAHAVIIHEGDSADTLFILLSGRVKVYASSEGGKEVIITTHGAGEYVGELALDGGMRSASVMTLEPTTCSLVTAATLRAFVADHPDFAQHLIRKLIARVRQATDSVKSLALQDVYGRVVGLLQQLAPGDEGAPRTVPERLTQQEIAERVGSSREMVSRILKDLTVGGYVHVEAGRITLLKKLPAAW
ncbi:MAG TPA: Crp/Fnr family transcriptional regulator [Burkholderiaceae bacterium]